ncbi:ATPase [Leptospira kobayashii]|uniref:ATPase n=1 Tax=Leptospira kobayashii TaxID=1917830 RepID=A0ABN6KIK3_9LEPT|nr:SRPBCC family protein [Leptospira kobayashii]BDA79512.1 ATPase [Leptospira kobayashii]
MNQISLNHNLKLSMEKRIKASQETVWEILTSPKYIKEYLYGTDAISDWKKGSSLIFKGEWEGKAYEEKGVILEFEKPYIFKYTYFTAFFELPELPENYAIIENKLTTAGEIVTINLTQSGFTSEEKLKHSEDSWNHCLEIIKKIAETI